MSEETKPEVPTTPMAPPVDPIADALIADGAPAADVAQIEKELDDGQNVEIAPDGKVTNSAPSTEPPAGTPLTPEERASSGLPPLETGADAAAVAWRAEQATEVVDAAPTIDIVEDDSQIEGTDEKTIDAIAGGATITPDPETFTPEPLVLTDEERADLPALDHSATPLPMLALRKTGPGAKRLVHELQEFQVQHRCRTCGGVTQFDDATPHTEQAKKHGGALRESDDAFFCSEHCLPLGGI